MASGECVVRLKAYGTEGGDWRVRCRIFSKMTFGEWMWGHDGWRNLGRSLVDVCKLTRILEANDGRVGD
jgi:hypothetical protein